MLEETLLEYALVLMFATLGKHAGKEKRGGREER
jgi:hypothetical protein